MRKILLFLIGLIVFAPNLYAGTVSFDQLATSSDLTVSKYNSDLNTIYQDHNSNVQSSNILNDTVAEVDMADDANPRIRDYEQGGSGTECEFVYSGLLPTTAGSLSTNTSSGVAYPRGYRVSKASATAHTYTASKWTWVDIDINGDFTYAEQAIGSSTPSVASNSIRLARVSTDGTTIVTVQDLRRLGCLTTAFDQIQHSTSQPTLHDMFINGIPGVGRFRGGEAGFIQGLQIEWLSATTFKVKAGSAWIGSEYRRSSSDLTVTTGADDPTTGVSGIDTGSIATNTTYHVYAVAGETSVKTLSISYSTNSTNPSGVAAGDSRYLGRITTDGGTAFTSHGLVSAYTPEEKELIGGWINFVGDAATIASPDNYNVSSLTDNGTGNYTVTWDVDFATNVYAAQSMANTTATGEPLVSSVSNQQAGSCIIRNIGHGGAATDAAQCSIIAVGDRS